MRAVILEHPGKERRYRLSSIATPGLRAHEVLVKVAYAGINRADLLQSQGKYPLPAGIYPVPGMELSGEIVACGSEVVRFKPGDNVCALVKEGAFAEMATVDAAHVLPVPQGITLGQSACLPEACFTVWISLIWQAHLVAGESVLIHGGTSGIGSIGVQVAKLLGARVFTTAGSEEKCALCDRLGADVTIPYNEEDYVTVIKQATNGAGVDVILDMVGGDYFSRNLEALAQGGRLAVIAFQKGARIEANLAPVLLKHLQVTGSTLRSRPPEEKARLAREVEKVVWPGIAEGRVKPVIDRAFPLEEAEKALERMDQSLNIGKILLKL